MNRPIKVRLIGLFVLGALALATGLTLIFGNHYFGTAEKYVAYFEGSVNGLTVGAPVKLKGVTIGRVNDILVHYDVSNNRVLTPVITEIDFSKVLEKENDAPIRRLSFSELVQRGLRARLAIQSLVTNQLYVEVNFFPNQVAHLVTRNEWDFPEIPTLPSGKEEFEATAQKMMSTLREAPLKETVDTLLHVLTKTETLITAPEIRTSFIRLNETLEALHHLIIHLDKKVEVLSDGVEGTTHDSRLFLKQLTEQTGPLLETSHRVLHSAEKTFHHAQNTLTSIETFADPESELNSAIHEMAQAAHAVRVLAETLERHPENVIYGKERQKEKP